MSLITPEEARAVARSLWMRYCDLCDQARISKTTAAALVGVSPTRHSQLSSEDKPATVGLVAFLRLNQLVPRIEQGLAEGWLPAGSIQGEAQRAAVEKLTS